MSTALRPVLRPSLLTSLPSTTTSSTYVCEQCRHARLLRRPKRPYTFTQLITLSDGSAFTIRTTSPHPVYRSTRDTRNAPLWNPSSRALMNAEDDEAGRLAGFRARYGSGFDAQRPAYEEGPLEVQEEKKEAMEGGRTEKEKVGEAEIRKVNGEERAIEGQGEKPPQPQQGRIEAVPKMDDLEDDGWDFGDEDANMLDLISSYGQEDIRQKDAPMKTKRK